MPKEINPKAIATEDIPALSLFFDSQAAIGIKIWKKDKPYTFNDGMAFLFTHDVFQRPRRTKPAEVRYEIISNMPALGSGVSGTVKPVAGTLAFLETGVRFKEMGRNGKRRVVKIQSHDPEKNPLKNLEKEFRYTFLAPHCAIKIPVVTNTSPRCTSYLTMRRFPGEDLFNIIVDGRCTTQERIALSKGLLQALKKQVADAGLVHRDIKPENIIVHMLTMNINIIDYAFCREAGADDTSSGTRPYAAPEIFHGETQKIEFNSDIYSMGRVLALLWNVDHASYCDTKAHISLTPEKKLEGLFHGITDLDPTVKDLIKTTLMGMLNHDPTKRLSLNDAITAFSRIGVSGTEPVLIDAGAGVPTTTSDTGAGPTKVADAIGAFGLMPPPPRAEVDKPPLPDNSFDLR